MGLSPIRFDNYEVFVETTDSAPLRQLGVINCSLIGEIRNPVKQQFSTEPI